MWRIDAGVPDLAQVRIGTRSVRVVVISPDFHSGEGRFDPGTDYAVLAHWESVRLSIEG